MEQGEDAKYYQFLKTWPLTDDFPGFYTEDERELLKGSPFLAKLEKIEDNYLEDYNFMVEKIPEISRFSYAQFK
jgi:hypothetical protein